MSFDSDVVKDVLTEVAKANPRAYAMCHKNENDHPEAWDFIILGARELHKIDPKYGLNGKRGNPRDLSSDIIAYGFGTGINCRVFDILIGAGEHMLVPKPLEQITCNEVTQRSKDPVTGQIMTIWVNPYSVTPIGDSVPIKPEPEPVKPVEPKKRDYSEFGDARGMKISEFMFADYKEANGFGLDGGCGAWMARIMWDSMIGGMSPEEAIAKHRPHMRKELGLDK